MKDYCRYVDVFQGVDEIDLPEPQGLAAAWRLIKGRCGNNTPAAALPDQVPKETVDRRFARLLDLVQTVGGERSGRELGKTLPVLVEGTDEQCPGRVTGRLGNNVMVHFPGDKSLIGTIVPVKLNGYHGFYYIGERA